VSGLIEVTERVAYWTEQHPDWEPNPDWPEEVGCVLYEGLDSSVLIDPLIRDDLDADAWSWLDAAVAAATTPVVVLLTAPWHERSTRDVVKRYTGTVWADPVAHERMGDLPRRESVPQGIEVFTLRGVDEGQVAFFIQAEQTLVVGDFLLGNADVLRVCASPATRDTRAFLASLCELERLPVERVLVSHGAPVLRGGRDAISTALRSFKAS
jgi:glyoxylase-like metal-dependent hydrolase (beta-lactamase superfamily II)